MRVVMIKSDVRAREKPCLKCGYSLRKIDATHCPECGLSVWLSLNQNVTLEWSNPGWLRRMVTGCWVMAAAQLPALAAYLLLLAGVILPEMQHRDRVQRALAAQTNGNAQISAAALPTLLSSTTDYAIIRTAILLGAAYLIAYHAGMLLVVWNERRYPDRLATLRTCAWVVCGAAALVALAMFAWAIGPESMGLVGFGLKIVMVASGLVTWAYLRRLAQRVPHAALVKICAWLMLVPALSFLKVFPFFGLFLVSQFLWLVDFLPLVYLPLSAVLLIWFATIFRKAAASADVSWTSETAVATRG